MAKAIQAKLFREDLYYRLSAAIIHLPPLRERKEDICHLVSHFLGRSSSTQRGSKVTISLTALQLLEQHNWPGNVRELESVIQRAVLMARCHLISADIIREILSQSGSTANHVESGPTKEYIASLLNAAEAGEIRDVFHKATAALERELLSQAIQRARGNQSTVSQWLGLSRPTTRQKLAQYGLLP